MENELFISLSAEDEQNVDGGGFFGAIAGTIIGTVGGCVTGAVICAVDAVISKSSPNTDVIFGCTLAGAAIGLKVGIAVPGGFF